MLNAKLGETLKYIQKYMLENMHSWNSRQCFATRDIKRGAKPKIVNPHWDGMNKKEQA